MEFALSFLRGNSDLTAGALMSEINLAQETSSSIESKNQMTLEQQFNFVIWRCEADSSRSSRPSGEISFDGNRSARLKFIAIAACLLANSLFSLVARSITSCSDDDDNDDEEMTAEMKKHEQAEECKRQAMGLQ